MKNEKIVWQFTNKRKLTKKEFIDYFERKVFKTIRKYNMLPKNNVIRLKKSDYLNTKVLKYVLSKKFKVKFSKKPDFSSCNLSQAAEDIFANILKAKFEKPKISGPLYFLSDKEVELYAKLVGIKGKKRKKNKKIQKLFAKFLKKNPDLEHNIIKAAEQIC